MVYKISDAKHLAVMVGIQESIPTEIDVKFLVESALPAKIPSLTGDIVKLCGMLRSDGFEKYASELESKLLILKATETHLYQTTNETGESLVDSAHPDGDHEVEKASDNLGDVETIVSQHNKILDVVNKKPSKHAEAIIDMVKLALLEKKSQHPASLFFTAYSLFKRVNQGVKHNATSLSNLLSKINDDPRVSSVGHEVYENLQNLISKANDFDEHKFDVYSLTDSNKKVVIDSINEYETILNKVKDENLPRLKKNINNILQDEGKEYLTKVYRWFIPSDFKDVSNSIIGLEKALTEARSEINTIRNLTNKTEDSQQNIPQDRTKANIDKVNSLKANLNKLNIKEDDKKSAREFLDKMTIELENKKVIDFDSFENALNEFSKVWRLG